MELRNFLAAKSSQMLPLGTPAPAFSLPDTSGNAHPLADAAGSQAYLVMFICNHCPYVKAITKKLVRDTTDLIDLGINRVALMPNDTVAYPDDSAANMLLIAKEFDFPFPYLLDETQEVARAYGAVCTPDFFGYNAKLQLQYRGMLDESGKNPDKNDVRRDLYLAMKQVAQSGVGPPEQIPSMGCSIKWRNP